MMKIIRRESYLQKIRPFIGRDIIKVLIGQRRVGKSSIMKDLIEVFQSDYRVSRDEILYLNREDLQWDHIRSYQDLYQLARSYRVICIDEIQEITEWERAIRSLQTEGGHDIYITGSNATMLSSELSTLLSGRYVSFEIFPLTYREYLDFSVSTHSESAFLQYVRYGGLPYIHHLDLVDEVVLSYLRDILDTILLRDIILRNNIRNTGFFHRLMIYLSTEIGHIFSAKTISNYLKSEKTSLSPTTILDYLQYAIDANLLFRLDRYDIKGKRVFETRQKFFFTDIGIRHALVGGYRQIDVGGVLENIVALHMRSSGWIVQVGEWGDREVDFVCSRGDEKIYLQVAYLLSTEEVRNREFAPLLEIGDNHPKYVLTLDTGASGQIEGVRWVYLPDFLFHLS